MKDNKIVAIGDVHGRTDWVHIVEKEFSKCDKIVFIGDYLDSFDISGEAQLQNLKNILQLKRDHPDNVVLLLGNHDYHYIVDERYSGYNPIFKLQFYEVLVEAIKNKEIQLSYYSPTNKVLFTHAGVSRKWLKMIELKEYLEPASLSDFLNDLLIYKPYSFRFIDRNPYGDTEISGPLWIRPNSLLSAGVHVNQVVGHTQQEKITCLKDRIWLIDSPDLGEYLRIKDRNFKVKQIDNGKIKTRIESTS